MRSGLTTSIKIAALVLLSTLSAFAQSAVLMRGGAVLPLAGTDTTIPSAGTLAGTSVIICTDANGGITTVGCPQNTIPPLEFAGDYPCLVGAILADCQPGAPVSNISTTTHTVVQTDLGFRMRFTAGSATTLSLPVASSLTNGFFLALRCEAATPVTISATTSLVNGAASKLCPPNYVAYLNSDYLGAGSGNYFADIMPTFAAFPNCPDTGGNHLNISSTTGLITCGTSGGAGGGVSSITGDGSLISNSLTSGAVTLTLANAGAHAFWGNNTGSSAAPGYHVLAVADLPGTGATTVNQVTCTLGSTCLADAWIPMVIPAANDIAAVAGQGWSTGSACGSAATAVVRNGTNISTGYMQFAASQAACGQITIPINWDSAVNPWAQINFTQSGVTGSQTIVFQISVGCSSTTDDATWAAAQSFTTTTTGTTANTPYVHTLQLNGTSMTSCAAGATLNWKINASSGTNGTPNAQLLTFYWPYKLGTAPTTN